MTKWTRRRKRGSRKDDTCWGGKSLNGLFLDIQVCGSYSVLKGDSARDMIQGTHEDEHYTMTTNGLRSELYQFYLYSTTENVDYTISTSRLWVLALLSLS